MKISRLGLRGRLLGAFSGAAVFSAFIAGVGLWGVITLASELEEIGGVRLPSILGLEEVYQAQTEIDSAENALLSASTQAEAGLQLKRIEACWKRVEHGWGLYEPLPQTIEEAALWQQFVPLWGKWKSDHQTYLKLVSTYLGLASDAAAKSQAYLALQQQALVTNGLSFSAAEDKLKALIELNTAIASQSRVSALSLESRLRTLFLALPVAALGLGVLGGFFVAATISKPLLRVIGAVGQGADNTSAAAGQLSDSSQGLAQGASRQAAALEETSASLEELSSMTKQNASAADSAGRFASTARDSVDQGYQHMQELSLAMKTLLEATNEIVAINKSIDEIAFQTNILALNAAVEAARAGEAGAGFAVVSEEVRSLAQRAASAARETSSRIQVTVERSSNGARLAALAETSLASIKTQIGDLSAQVSQIAVSSGEQSKGLGQINQAIAEMDKATQSNASHSEESAAAAQELSAQAVELQAAVSDLVTLLNGARAPSAIS